MNHRQWRIGNRSCSFYASSLVSVGLVTFIPPHKLLKITFLLVYLYFHHSSRFIVFWYFLLVDLKYLWKIYNAFKKVYCSVVFTVTIVVSLVILE